MYNWRIKASAFLRLIDFLLAPAVLAAAMPMKAARRAGLHRLPLTRRTLQAVGIFPILDHYYEPLFRTDKLDDLRCPRLLRGSTST